ncbi:MAG: alpha/beta family hydrolase, partial [Actinomycetota bacterium]
RVRDEHLYRIDVPMLFIQGTADPFAQPSVLRPVLERLGARASYAPIEDGDHSFNVRGARRPPSDAGAGLAELAAPWMRTIVEDV